MKLSMRKHRFFIAPALILGILLFGFIGGEVVKQLWNWLAPPLFGWRQITFWQAFGLLALCRILFGGSGWHRSGGSSVRRRMKERMADCVGEGWERMAPEERERFRQRMRERCGVDPSTSESKGQ